MVVNDELASSSPAGLDETDPELKSSKIIRVSEQVTDPRHRPEVQRSRAEQSRVTLRRP